ncbi:hypothetical protein ACJRPK_16550 [Aquimarina sp. 2-A2]|uniref:hypothetical protein n=1 Tax=Aquimarina sp. 2-A2 TaxID=3382644 RepID=UPI00387F17D4
MKSSHNNIPESGFTTPENYFETLNESLYNAVNSTTKVPVVSKPVKTGFIVPEGYFETLSEVVINHSKQKQNSPIFYLTKTQLTVMASIAAMFILILTIVNAPSKTFTINDLTIADIENYLGEEPIDYENYQSYLYSTTEELTNTMSFSSIEEKNIENYLLSEDIQVDLLIQE